MNKVNALVLSTIDVKDSDVIVKLLCAEEGVITVYYRGVRKSKAKIKKGLFTPLAFLSLELQKSKYSDILLAKDTKRLDNQLSALNDFRKLSQLLFMAECVSRVTHPGQCDTIFFEWLLKHLNTFYTKQYEAASIINWLLEFLEQMGVGVNLKSAESGDYFSFTAGKFTKSLAEASLNNQENLMFREAALSNFEKREYRQIITKVLVSYLEFHFNLNNPIKSLSVLKELMD